MNYRLDVFVAVENTVTIMAQRRRLEELDIPAAFLPSNLQTLTLYKTTFSVCSKNQEKNLSKPYFQF